MSTQDKNLPSFRVRDTGQLLTCKCRCETCTGEEKLVSTTHRSCTAATACSVRRHLEKADRRASSITAAAAARARETGIIPR